MTAPEPSCAICAWRAGCNKKFSIVSARHCADYCLDVTVHLTKDAPETETEDEEEKKSDEN